MAISNRFDVVIVGAGVLGVTIAYWLSTLYDCTIAVADLEGSAGAHTTSRNTGVIHRPFYLDPGKKRIFARTSLISHPLWHDLAKSASLPWRQTGTFNVALNEVEARTVEQYARWGVENGMAESELELLGRGEVRSREPEVSCLSALVSKTDVSVDFGALTRHIWGIVRGRGVRFLGGHRFVGFRKREGSLLADFSGPFGIANVACGLLVNAAGGGALDVAHKIGLGRGYAVLNFRGEYWVVDEPLASRVNSNIYRPPRFPGFPFLDPHFVVRADGSRQIGPNAVLVPGPYVYSGLGLRGFRSFLDRPVGPKGRLLTNRDFFAMALGEWRSSLSKRAMCDRVRKFVPALDPAMLNRRAVFGVRGSLVDRNGFVPEALILLGEDSVHVLNYNSPGASGAPAFSAMVLDEMMRHGMLQGLKQKEQGGGIPGWGFNSVTSQI